MNILEYRTGPNDLARRESPRPRRGEDEVRFLEARFDLDGDSEWLRGYAAVFDQEAMITDFVEVLRQGAFAKTLQEQNDFFAFWNHNSDYVIGRTKNKSMELSEDEQGLRFSMKPAETTWGQDVARMVRDGLIDKMSFGFRVMKDTWSEREEDVLREIHEVRLYEISPVPIPAYAGTTIEQGRNLCTDMQDRNEAMEPEPRRTHSTQDANFLLDVCAYEFLRKDEEERNGYDSGVCNVKA